MKAKETVFSSLPFIFLVGVFLIGWEILSRLEILNPALVSRPSEIFWTTLDLFNPFTESFLRHSILFDVYVSLYRLSYAFVIATLAGVSLGLLMGRSNLIYGFFDPLITVLMPVPGIAWAPIFIIRMGFGDLPIITVGALAAFFPILYNTAAGVRSVDKKFVWSAQSAGANQRIVFFKIFLPWSAAYIFTGLKLALARAWRTIIAVEMIAASVFGLGYVIFEARDYTRHSIVYAGIVILAITYFLIENVIKWIEKRTVEKWGMIRS